MKKIAGILLLLFVIALVASSCNKETCPAYSKADVKKVEHVG